MALLTARTIAPLGMFCPEITEPGTRPELLSTVTRVGVPAEAEAFVSEPAPSPSFESMTKLPVPYC